MLKNSKFGDIDIMFSVFELELEFDVWLWPGWPVLEASLDKITASGGIVRRRGLLNNRSQALNVKKRMKAKLAFTKRLDSDENRPSPIVGMPITTFWDTHTLLPDVDHNIFVIFYNI